MNYNNYSFYKGEDSCPFSDAGRCFWWRVESYAARNGDDKKKGKLSPTMLSFIKERVWQSRSGWTTSWEEAKARAQDCYSSGLWNAGYISDKDAPRGILR